MLSRRLNPVDMALSCSLVAAVLLALVASESDYMAQAYPTASIGLFAGSNNLGNKLPPNDDSAERSFRDFIGSKSPESTMIGELKPNASALELMILRNKIANAILSMQQSEKNQQQQQPQSASLPPSSSSSDSSTGADCYIEVTRIEKIPGKCHKVGGGLPICESDNYMAISSDCN